MIPVMILVSVKKNPRLVCVCSSEKEPCMDPCMQQSSYLVIIRYIALVPLCTHLLHKCVHLHVDVQLQGVCPLLPADAAVDARVDEQVGDY